MVASLLGDTRVSITYEGGKTHIIDLNELAESDLKKLKIAAHKNILSVNAVRGQLYEFIRRINTVLDTRTNNAACLDMPITDEHVL